MDGGPCFFCRSSARASGFLSSGLADSLWMLFAGRILDGITGGNISTAQAYIADITTTENRAKGMGLIGAAFGLGFIFGPAIGGILSRWGIHVPFLLCGGSLFCQRGPPLFHFARNNHAGSPRATQRRHVVAV